MIVILDGLSRRIFFLELQCCFKIRVTNQVHCSLKCSPNWILTQKSHSCLLVLFQQKPIVSKLFKRVRSKHFGRCLTLIGKSWKYNPNLFSKFQFSRKNCPSQFSKMDELTRTPVASRSFGRNLFFITRKKNHNFLNGALYFAIIICYYFAIII